MAVSDALLERIREGYARIAEIEMVASNHPGDRYVLASLDGVRHQVEQFEEEWKEVCRIKQVEVCRYKLAGSESASYTAVGFAKSILEFQELFSQIYDSVKNGPKRRARVSGEVVSDTTFQFAYSYPGSLGVVLTMEGEVTLLDSKFDEAISAFGQIATVTDEHAVRDMAKALGDAVVRKTFDWSKANYFAGYSVDVTWQTAKGFHRGQAVDRRTLGTLVEVISRTSDVERRKFKVTGTLVMIDVKRKRFRFVVPEGGDFPGELGDALDLSHKWAVNTRYVAELELEAVTQYATQQTTEKYTLIALQVEPSA